LSKKSIEFRIATLTVSSSSIVTVKYKNVFPEPTIDEISELITKGINLISNRPFVLLTDLSDSFGEWDNETKLFVANHRQLNQLKIAEAIVSQELATQLLVVGYKSQKEGKAEVEMFKEKKEAIEWLLSKI
jgi:hypothetical protein